MGFGVTVLVLGVAVLFAVLGFPEIAVTVVGLDLVALVGLFVYGNRATQQQPGTEDEVAGELPSGDASRQPAQ